MLATNTTENVFRFMQLRPPSRGAGPDDRLDLRGDTEFARRLAQAAPTERTELARRFLAGDGAFETRTGSAWARQLLTVMHDVVAQGGTVGDLIERIEGAGSAPGDEPADARVAGSTWARQLLARIRGASSARGDELADARVALSDALLAVKFGARPGARAVHELGLLYRALTLLLDGAPRDPRPLAAHLRRPLRMPEAFGPQPSRPGPAGRTKVRAGGQATTGDGQPVSPAALLSVLGELRSLARHPFLRLPGRADGSPVFTLTERGVARLSPEAAALLDELAIDPLAEPIHRMTHVLETELALAIRRDATEKDETRPVPDTDPAEERPYLRDVGVADLLVVKQHLTGYERTDVAHIENALAGERRSRTHRMLNRTEETLTTERETLHERETELETADRFELNRETARTARRDQQIGFGLTLSGKYGPTVEFTSNLQADVTTSVEESTRSATTYAKDVVERSLDRVSERVREEQVRRIIREEEETNLHELANDGGTHISGVYQFVEKVYESQIFNYGIRQMFDFMVPEPGSYLWHLERSAPKLNLPTPPPKLEELAPDASAVNEITYLRLAALFGAEGVETPPETYLTASLAKAHGQEETSEEEEPRSILEADVDVPSGYRPLQATVRAQALTDDELTLAVTVGGELTVWQPGAGELTDVGDGHQLAAADLTLTFPVDTRPYVADDNTMQVQVMGYETNTFSVVVEVVFERTQTAFTAWQLKTYEKLVSSYRDLVQAYEQKVAQLKAEAEAAARRDDTPFGAPPSQNDRTVRTELKKHCLAIVTRQRYQSFDAVVDADPPYFPFVEAAVEGAFIRFFEQAFEWDQMQYVCYSYFWARPTTWEQRFLRQEIDPEFAQFLQAGAARVVVPARPGFELALTHYLETGEIWNGAGEPPAITSPLYVPIITEIRERTDAPQGEIPVGDPWPTRVPTPLAILRKDDELPAWERVDPAGWEWREIELGG